MTSISRRLSASIAAAFGSALVAYAAVMLAILIATGGAFTNLPQFFGFFLAPAAVVFVLLAVSAIVGGLTTIPRTLVFSIVAAVFGTYLGTLVFFLLEDPTNAPTDTTSSAGLDVIFAVATVIATFTVGRRLYSWMLAYAAPRAPEIHRVALVRSPSPMLAKGEVTHVKRKVVKVEKADTQWEAYVAALEAEGFTTIEIEPADQFPDSVFIEDTVVMLGQTAVIASPGAESRRGEQDGLAETLAELGLEVQHIRLPGTLDGGDVLKIGKTVYIGRGGRTNAEGIRQFRAIAGELGYTVIAVPVSKALHLKSSVTALPDGTVLGHPSLVDHPELFERYLEVPEPSGVAVVVLSSNAVLMAESAPKTAALIADLGYRVVSVDIGEFEKLEGCVTCLSVRIR